MEHPKNKQAETPTPAQEASLRKLFGGTSTEREQAIAAQHAEMKERLKVLMKAKGNSEKLIGIMFSDLKVATSSMKENPANQFWRRTAIRTLAATIDGIIFSLKETALATGRFKHFSFQNDDVVFLKEEADETTKGKKPRMPGFRDNLKRTFKLFSKIHGIECPADFNTPGFTALCDTYELRHKLMHPKSYWEFAVTDEQKQSASDGIHWLDVELQRLFDSCSEAIQNGIK